MKSGWLSRFLIVLGALIPFLAEAATAAGPGVQIREWDVPTPSSWPRDPAVAPDGSLWYTGMRADIER